MVDFRASRARPRRRPEHDPQSGLTRAACPPSTRRADTAATAAPTSRRSSSAPGQPASRRTARSSCSSTTTTRCASSSASTSSSRATSCARRGSAEEGLAAIAEAKPDLILLDVMMPHVDGWEMLRRVQERYGAGAIPVVMFSGQVDEQAQALAASSGAQGFVGKPFDLQHLIDRRSRPPPSDRARARALRRRGAGRR